MTAHAERTGSAQQHGSDAPNLFTSPDWLAVIEETYGFETRPAGDAPAFAFIDDALGQRCVAPPFGDYAERCPAPGLSQRARTMRKAFPRANCKLKIAGECELPGASVLRRALHHEVDPRTAEVSASFARATRKAERSGLTVRRISDSAAIERFYALHARQRIRTFASLPQPLAFFEAIAARFFPDRGFLLEARCGNEVASVLFVLRHDNTIYYKFGASDPDALAMRPNNLLMTRLVDITREEGAARLDLGMTPREGGLARFKRGMGASEMPLVTFGWPPLEGEPHDDTREKALLGQITARIAARDPSPAEADVLATALYRYFA